jgi:mannose-6-phosphate isomerase-like protein (cupin superfamily)
MKAGITVAAAAMAMALGGAAAAQGAEQPRFVSAKDLDALVAKMTDGLASARIPAGAGAIVMIAHRDKDGEVEVHKTLADELIVREGHARIRVGGTVTGDRQTAADEFRGGTIAGGTVYDLGPGDVLYIPVGMPHQMLVQAGTTITYLAAKFPG